MQCLTYLTFGFKQAANIVHDPIHEEFRRLAVVLKTDPEWSMNVKNILSLVINRQNMQSYIYSERPVAKHH